MTAAKFSAALLVLSSLLAGFLPQPAEAADPFYTRLLERGVRELEVGLTDDAQKKLRTACFGFLDEPNLLAEGLMQLGRAQARAGNTADLERTARRLVEIEDRFDAYSNFDGILKTAFENALRSALPQGQLERMSLFEHLGAATDTNVPNAVPKTPKQQLRELERVLAGNPDDVDALLSLAQMRVANGKAKAAIQLLDRLLALEPGHERAVCMRAEVAANRRECAPTLAGLDLCPQLTDSNPGAAHILKCLVEAQRTVEAMELLQSLPAERRQAATVAKAARKVDRATAALDAAPENAVPDADPTRQFGIQPEPDETSEPAEAAQPKATDEPQKAEVPEVTIVLTLAERVRRLRQEISQSQVREQLEVAMRQAIVLAEDYPASEEAQYVAAEIAYLSSDWRLAAEYFRRGGLPTEDQPELLFYLAVATYELGNPTDAREIIQMALPKLQHNPFVDSYIDRILASPAP